jgi:hypothetical protein
LIDEMDWRAGHATAFLPRRGQQRARVGRGRQRVGIPDKDAHFRDDILAMVKTGRYKISLIDNDYRCQL